MVSILRAQYHVSLMFRKQSREEVAAVAANRSAFFPTRPLGSVSAVDVANRKRNVICSARTEDICPEKRR